MPEQLTQLVNPEFLFIAQFIPYVFAAVAIIVVWTVPFFRRLASAILSMVAGAIVLLFALWTFIFWYPVVWVLRRFIPMAVMATGIEGLLGVIGIFGQDPLIKGDKLRAAEMRWPRNRFAFLYEHVPDDIRRPLLEDGKLIGGYPTTWLTDRYVTSGIVRSSVEISIFSFLVIFIPIVLFFLWIILSTIFSGLLASLSSPPPIIERWPGLPPVTAGSFSWHLHLIGQALKVIGGFFALNSLTLGHWALLAGGIALLVLPGIIYSWRATKGAKYQMPTKDAEVRWSYRAETRQILNTTYNRQVELASGYLKGSPLFYVGEATGTLRFRGDLTAPSAGQTIAIDQDALFQHLLVLGGTGEGKTAGVLRPMMRQLMPMKHYGMYVCDAKGVLWRDAFTIAKETGRANDVLIIGTGIDQFGVDPIAELTPTQVAATLRSVLQQISGGSAKDSFWPDMAANILRNVFTVAHSYARTAAGVEETENGLNPYSLWWVYQAVLNETMLANAIDTLGKAAADLRTAFKAAANSEDRELYKAEFRKLQPPDLLASVRYLTGAWKGMATQTKTGILANITQLLDGFSGAYVLRDRFASGRSQNTINLTEALRGKIVLNALSSVEDGLPARLVIMLLKTTLYREARVREAEWKALTPMRNPQEAPCVVIMDEVQEIVSADPTSGLSDATFWNVARSSGLAGIFATQTIAALEQAIGLEAAANFLQQARSKIFFRSEDRATVEYACWCAGEFERDRVYEDGLYESIEFKEMLTGESYLEPVNALEKPQAGPSLFFQIGWNLMRQRQFSWDILPSKPFIGSEGSAPIDMESSTLAHYTANRQNVWREQDREWRYRTTGNDIAPALTPADLIGMGRWHAYAHIQRAGAVRQDLMLVKHEHS